MIGKTNTDRDRHMDIHKGEVKVTVILSKMIFPSSKPLHAHVQYVFNESAKYQNLSTNSLCQADFTTQALSSAPSQSIQKPSSQELPKNGCEKSCYFNKNIFFSIILLPVQYVCNEFAKYQTASTNILR